MATTLQELVNMIGFDVNEQEWANADKKMEALVKKGKSVGKKLTIGFTAPFIAFTAFATKAASDVQETDNLFKQVMGSLASEANEFADNYAGGLRRMSDGTKLALAQLQGFLVGMGMTKEKALETSKSLVEASGDMSSAWNKTTDEMRGRFLAAMSGSSEVLDQFGINIKVSALAQEALAQGMTKSITKMTELEKVGLRVAIIQKTLTKQGITGDAMRTSLEFANAWRSLTDQFRGFMVVVGNQIIPIITPFVNKLVDMVNNINKMNPAIIRFMLILGGILALVGPLILALTTAIGIGGAISASITAITGLLGPIGIGMAFIAAKALLIVAAVSAVIVAIVLIGDELYNFFQGNETLLGKFIGEWKDIKPKIMSFLEPLVASINSIWNTVKGIFNNVVRFVKSIIDDDMNAASDAMLDIMEGLLQAAIKWFGVLWSVLPGLLAELLVRFLPVLFVGIQKLRVAVMKRIGEFIAHLLINLWNRLSRGLALIVANAKKILTGGDILGDLVSGKLFKLPANQVSTTLTGAIDEKRGLRQSNNININATVKADITGAETEAAKQGVAKAGELSIKKVVNDISLSENFPVFE